jgi:hypothetical protein
VCENGLIGIVYSWNKLEHIGVQWSGIQVMLFRYRLGIGALQVCAVVRVPIAITMAVALGLGKGRTTFALAMIPMAGSSQVCIVDFYFLFFVIRPRTMNWFNLRWFSPLTCVYIGSNDTSGSESEDSYGCTGECESLQRHQK